MVATGLSPQAEQRLSRRLQQAVVAAGAVMLLAISLGMVSGHAAPVIPLVLVALGVLAWVAARVLLYRDADGSTGWPARVPSWSLRPYCPGLVQALADEMELTGRLLVGPQGLRWTPSAGAERLGASAVEWDRSSGAWSTGRGIAGLPTTYLRVTDAQGVTSDLWVRGEPALVETAVRACLGDVER